MKEIGDENGDKDEPRRENQYQETGTRIYNSSNVGKNGEISPSTSVPLRRCNTETSVGNTTISSEGIQHVTPYERLSQHLSNDQRVIKEISLGRRIAFYRIRGEIGSGNFSQVKLGIHTLTKDKVAIKILDKTKLDQKTQRLLSREITSMERLHHPNIIRLYEVVETLAKLHIIMEFASGGELFTKISTDGRLPEINAKHIFAQLTAAVEHMHDNNIIHRDLKAENVFYASPTLIKVGDFGFSTISKSNEALNTFCGSPPYAAPELFKDESYNGVFVDIWAMGILLYFMVTGAMPFRAETVAKLKKCILDGSYTVPTHVSDSCVFLIRGILRHIPHDRLTISEIKRCEWLTGEDFPCSLEPYNLNPSYDSSLINSEEQEARAILNDLGIKEEHFKQASIRDSRCSITGTYRIVLHRIQRKKCGIQENMDFMDEKNNSGSNLVIDKGQTKRITPIAKAKAAFSKPRSRTCSIL